MNEVNLYESKRVLKEMKEYYYTGQTRSLSFRIEQLKKLKEIIYENQEEIIQALESDLGRHENESYAAEIGSTLNSISFTIKNLKKWSKIKKVKTPLTQFGSKSYIKPEPYGIALIIGPFNFPFNLCIEPMAGAMAAGNCVVVKPSEQTPSVSKLINHLLSKNFSNNYIRVVEGGEEVISSLINTPFDYIFFTGSVSVGRIVMAAASKNLVPVTLELGGKSPCIIHSDANIKVAAERVALGKFFNAGQICIAPDYLIVHESVRYQFIEELKDTIRRFYGDDVSKSKDFARIVNERHTDRLISILKKDKDKIVFGGGYNLGKKYIEPTLIDDVTWEDASMEEEVFGPILPIMSFTTIEGVTEMLNEHPKPLALYIFTENRSIQEKVLEETSSGGACVNDTVSHFTNHHLPFGGVGSSGIGGYHGEESFKTFSHMKSILNKSTAVRIRLLFPPYTPQKLNMIKKVLK